MREMPEEMRIGRFTITRDVIWDDPVAVRAVLAGVIVLKAEATEWNQSIEYTGLCEAFEPIKVRGGMLLELPVYAAQMRNDEGVVSFAGWTKLAAPAPLTW